MTSDGSGRFDLPVPHGTCYLAEEPIAARLEVTRRRPILSADFVAGRRLLTATRTVEMRPRVLIGGVVQHPWTPAVPA